MKKSSLFAFGAACLLSCAALSFEQRNHEVRADEVVDIGEISLYLNPGSGELSTKTGIYLLSTTPNDAPYPYGPGHGSEDSWDICVFKSNETNALLKNDVAVNNNVKIKKINSQSYYVDYSAAFTADSINTDDTLLFQGNWSAVADAKTYTFSIDSFEITWDGSSWVGEEEPEEPEEPFVVPDLEFYDTLTLFDAGYDDFDHTAFNFEDQPSPWNTFALSEENETKSFVFEFLFETYEALTGSDTIDFRIGGSGSWDQGHFYKFNINKDGIQLTEHNNTGNAVGEFKRHAVDLTPGTRHLIQFGSIFVEDSSTSYNFIKFDEEFVEQKIITPVGPISDTKVGLYTNTNKFFLGSSSKPQKERVDTLTFDHFYEDETKNVMGIYLDGPENEIPVLENWGQKGVPASKYNALVNGQPLYTYNSSLRPLVKHSDKSEDNYYISFDGKSFNEGDVVTLSDEFHFHSGGKNYVMSLEPISFLYNGEAFEAIDDIYDFLIEQLQSGYNLDYYSDENAQTISELLQEAVTILPTKTIMKALWDAYLGYVDDLDAIPIDESKIQALLQAKRAEAMDELNALIEGKEYDTEQLNQVNSLLQDAQTAINAANSFGAIKDVVDEYKPQLLAIKTKLQYIEEKLLDPTKAIDYELLENYDVATTTDLCVVGDLKFTSGDDNYGSGGLDDYSTRIATSSDNENGNLVFQFKFKTTDPEAGKYNEQVNIRLRGIDSNCYIFKIASRDFDEGVGVTLGLMVDDVVLNSSRGEYVNNEKDSKFIAANKSYEIACGAIDLKGYERTLLFIKVDGEVVIRKIVDSIQGEPMPTVRIMDSGTKDDAVTTLSPLEAGTTKTNNSSIVGRLLLDKTSDDKHLYATLEQNDIPVGADLLPLQQGAFQINFKEVDAYRPETSTHIKKISATKYEIMFDHSKLTNGEIITIEGLFGVFNGENLIKTVHKLFKSQYTYNAGSKSWTQDKVSVDVARADAKDALEEYNDSSKYSENGLKTIQGLIASYSNQIDAADTIEKVEEILTEALERLNAVPTALTEYKANAKEELQSYKSKDSYREEEQEELLKILNDAFEDIDGCSDKASVDLIVDEAKESIDALKTAAEKDAEDLASKKKLAKADVEAYVGLLEMERYSDENVNALQALALQARSDIEKATSEQEIDNIVQTFKEAVKQVQTKDGSTFNGETYDEPAKKKKKGCGGSVIAASSIISLVSLFGLVLISKKRKQL